MKTRPRFTPFLEKPRSWRMDQYVSRRWQIHQDPNGRGVFTSQHMMNGGVYEGEVYDAPGDSHWNDFRFVSKKHRRTGLVYTATVRTALLAAFDWAEEYAWDKERETLTEEEYAAAHPPLEFVSCGRNLFQIKEHDEPVFDRLGGVSAWGLRASLLREALEHIPAIHPKCTFDRGYKTGLGAVFVTKDRSITIDSIASLVQDFWDRGEVQYQDAAVDFSESNPENNQALRAMIEEMAAFWDKMDRRKRGEEDGEGAV